MDIEVSVVAGIVIKDECILISQRPSGKHLQGMWEFPGGKVNPGETHQIALKRELKEELGFEAFVGPEFHYVDHQYSTKRVKLWFYLCGIENGAPRSLESNPFQWIQTGALDQFKFPPADCQLLEDLKKTPISELLRRLSDFRNSARSK